MIKNKLKTKDYKIKTKRGFVSLFAVLISLVVLAIAIGISNVAYKENVLAFSAKEGSYAFFAADTGLECALFHDSRGLFSDPTNPEPVVDCAGLNMISDAVGTKVSFNFEYEMAGKNRCVEVSIDKSVPDPVNPTGTLTEIFSNGYNIDCNDVNDILNISNNRIVNRLLRASYPNSAPIVTP
ncbi:MAG: hypothetical protein KA007_00745 [Candidatus Pacebacteria bacterium]|jgi:hypothetical protein|nr:hypothetical protein [Candidatus Paceibacterota bacterium]